MKKLPLGAYLAAALLALRNSGGIYLAIEQGNHKTFARHLATIAKRHTT